ncbi:MAG: 3TM-type holin [Alphaproteobacteria bacterium]
MLETLIAKLGVPLLVTILSDALGGVDHPATKTASDVLKKVEAEIKTGGISADQLAEANRHAEVMAAQKSDEYRAALAEVNQSLRAEIASEDKYVRRMRPTFGYLMAITWAAQMLAIAYVIVFDTKSAGIIMSAMASLSAIWAVGLSVLGIYVYKRSEDKKIAGQKDVIFWNK